MKSILPRRLPESGPFAGLFRWLNALRDAVEACQLQPGYGTKITNTSKGQTVSIDETVLKGGSTTTDQPRWS